MANTWAVITQPERRQPDKTWRLLKQVRLPEGIKSFARKVLWKKFAVKATLKALGLTVVKDDLCLLCFQHEDLTHIVKNYEMLQMWMLPYAKHIGY